YDFCALKTDFKGNISWQKTFGGNDDDRCHAVKQLSTGDFILGGYAYSAASGNKTAPGFGSADGWLLRLDKTGNKLWEQTYGGSAFDSLEKIESITNGFALGGYSYSPASGNKSAVNYGLNDFWFIRTDTDGTALSDQTYA